MLNQFNMSCIFAVKNKLLFAILFSILFSVSSFGQVLWSTPAGQAWLTGTNWTGNIIPAVTDIAQFGIAPTSGVTGVGINMNGVTNNGTNNQAVGAIEILNTRTVNFKIGNSSTAVPGVLTLNGAVVNGVADVVLRNNAPGLFTIDNRQALGASTMTTALNDAVDNKIYIGNSGGITINTVISGVGKKLTLYGIGTGVLQLNAANTYTGLTTVGGCILQLNNAAGATLPATNDIIINNGGTLKISSNQTLHNITLATGGTLIIDAGITLTITGIFFNNGGIISTAGSIAYASGAVLYYGANFVQITSDAEFPSTAGPAGLIINNTAGVSLHAVRTISGVLNLIAGNFILNVNDFTSAGTTGLATVATHVVTNGMGKLIITNINAAAAVFPIGANNNSINPVIISNGNSAGYGARVEQGFTIPITDAGKAVNRTWILQSLSTPGAIVNVRFLYSAGDGNAAFNYASPVDHGIYLPMGFGWNINQTGLPQAGSYYVDTKVSSFLAATDLPMVIGNLGAILPTRNSVDLIAEKQNGSVTLNWTVNTSAVIHKIEIERSCDGRNFTILGTVANAGNRFIDNKLLEGTNFYRIKVTDVNGNTSYSIIAAIINKVSGFNMVSLLPNVVRSNTLLNITSAKKTKLDIVITDAMGRLVQKAAYSLVAGSNQFEINVADLAAGLYRITGNTAEGVTKTVAFVKQ